MMIKKLTPEMESYYDRDIIDRLTADGQPVHKGNDYERHLFARRLRQQGKTREEVKAALVDLGLDDIPARKRDAYIEDVLNSILVGFDNTEPIYGIAVGE